MIFLRLARFFQLFRGCVCPAFSLPGSRSDVQRTGGTLFDGLLSILFLIKPCGNQIWLWNYPGSLLKRAWIQNPANQHLRRPSGWLVLIFYGPPGISLQETSHTPPLYEGGRSCRNCNTFLISK